MSIGQLDAERIDRLCARGSVALFDRSAFLPLGVGNVPWDNAPIAALRAHMAARGCGRVLLPPAPGR
jgi:hypothetical protein